MNNKYTRVKYACYSANLSMAIVANLPPILFLTFRSLYGISYSLLGLLVLVNFVTQLSVDVMFSFFSHKFNLEKSVKMIPVLTFIGFLIYAVWPWLFPGNVYTGLVIGTIIFASSGGFSEVLISPVIAAIPSKDPDREMSKLHSIYAWGVVFVIVIGTIFLLVFGQDKWQLLVFVLMLIPLGSAALYAGAEMPELKTEEKTSGIIKFMKNKTLWLCVGGIFLGGAAECTMAQWASGYLEQGMKIPKVWGDICGVALFSVMLGLGRTLYAKIGKNIKKVLLLGSLGAAVCYFATSITNNVFIGLIACGFTGFCTSMLWPGSLIVASEYFPKGGVFIFALMAAGGDLGASIGPQLIGVITDAALKNPSLLQLANTLSIQPEQLGLKLGMLTGMLFPFFAVFLFYKIMKKSVKND